MNCETCRYKKLIGQICGCDGIPHESCYEAEKKPTMSEIERINRAGLKCPHRHINGNCLPVGGFCTAVPIEACPLVISAIRAQAEQENPKPLTLEELREREQGKSPVWLSRAKEWAFIASVNIEPYAQVWYFNSRALAKTVLFYYEVFYANPPKEARP